MRAKTVVAVAWCSVGLWACASIVGIEDAELDPLLEGGAGGAAAGSPGGGKGGLNGGGAGQGGSAGGAAGAAGSAGEAGAPSSGGTPGTAGSGAGGEGGQVGEDLCTRYCDAVMEHCTGELAVYTSVEVCLRACAALPPGVPGEETGNTVECRLFHAQQIPLIGEETTQCPIAGPGGQGVCGENCESFCLLERSICDPELPDTCVAACETLTDTGDYDVSQQEGRTVQCRLYHVSAATVGPMVHCPHAAGAPPCSL